MHQWADNAGRNWRSLNSDGEWRKCYWSRWGRPRGFLRTSGSTRTLAGPKPASDGRTCDRSCSAVSRWIFPVGPVCVQPSLSLRYFHARPCLVVMYIVHSVFLTLPSSWSQTTQPPGTPSAPGPVLSFRAKSRNLSRAANRKPTPRRPARQSATCNRESRMGGLVNRAGGATTACADGRGDVRTSVRLDPVLWTCFRTGS